MRALLRITAVTLCLLAGAACSTSNDHGETASQCSANFDLESRAEPLGSATELRRSIRERAAQPGTYSLRTLTEAAGWHDQWDRVVIAESGLPAENLNSAANLPGYCWSNLPESGFDRPTDNFYIFITGSAPTQVIRSAQGSELFRGVRSGEVLGPESRFQSVQPPAHLQKPYLELTRG
ncbi:hypothetical protein ABZ552_07800 [Nocardia sp. NPDC019219]|uniref:hypothetical protein n=1 Tax=Nocardia sp. NPDC019219 TaxID=3154590 RepID=UPI0033C3073D